MIDIDIYLGIYLDIDISTIRCTKTHNKPYTAIIRLTQLAAFRGFRTEKRAR